MKRKGGAFASNAPSKVQAVETTTLTATEPDKPSKSSELLQQLPSVEDVEHELERSIADVTKGHHPEICKRSNSLLKIKEKKIMASDRHRKLQIKNINELHDYEVQDAEALYQKSYQEIQNRLIAELKSEAQRIIQNIKLLRQSSDDENSNNGSSGNSKAGGIAAPGGGGADEANATRLARATRSATTEDTSLLVSTVSLTPAQLNEKIATKKRCVVATLSTIQKTLPEQSVREDFLDIVRDIEARAALYAAHIQGNKVIADELNTNVKVENDVLIINNDSKYQVGDSIVAYSIVSQESINGIITAISSNEVIARCGSADTGYGNRFAFRLGQIINGR